MAKRRFVGLPVSASPQRASTCVTGMLQSVASRWFAAVVATVMVAAASVAVPSVADAASTRARACWELIEPAGFVDVSDLPAETVAAVDCMAHYGITRGVSAVEYAPQRAVSRSQMARFLIRTAAALEVSLPGGSTAPFTDLDGLDAEARRSVARLHELGITRGRGASSFRPFETVPRWQMALFVTRTLAAAGVRVSAPAETVFEDLDGLPEEALNAVEGLAARAIMRGTSSKRFEPHAEVDRQAMALILAGVLEAAGARPARLKVSLSSDHRIVGGAVEGVVTALKPTGEPYRGLLVDVFAASGLTVDGACNLDSGARLNGADAGTSRDCEIDRGDPRTGSNGQVVFGLSHSENAADNTVYAWVGPLGQTFDVDGVLTEATATVTWGASPTAMTIRAPAHATFGDGIEVTARLAGPAVFGRRIVLTAASANGAARVLFSQRSASDGTVVFALPGLADPTGGAVGGTSHTERLLAFWDRNANSIHDGPAELSAVTDVVWRRR